MILTCALCAMHWSGYLQPACYKQLVNDRGSNDAVYYFPKALYRGATNNHFDSCFSLPAFQPVLLYPPNTTQQYASFINNSFWHFSSVSSASPL